MILSVKAVCCIDTGANLRQHLTRGYFLKTYFASVWPGLQVKHRICSIWNRNKNTFYHCTTLLFDCSGASTIPELWLVLGTWHNSKKTPKTFLSSMIKHCTIYTKRDQLDAMGTTSCVKESGFVVGWRLLYLSSVLWTKFLNPRLHQGPLEPK